MNSESLLTASLPITPDLCLCPLPTAGDNTSRRLFNIVATPSEVSGTPALLRQLQYGVVDDKKAERYDKWKPSSSSADAVPPPLLPDGHPLVFAGQPWSGAVPPAWLTSRVFDEFLKTSESFSDLREAEPRDFALVARLIDHDGMPRFHLTEKFYHDYFSAALGVFLAPDDFQIHASSVGDRKQYPTDGAINVEVDGLEYPILYMVCLKDGLGTM